MTRYLVLLLFFALAGCTKDDCLQVETYTHVEPIFVPRDSVENLPIRWETPRDLTTPNQIYYHNDRLYLNERGEGLHVIDNSDPADPVQLGFLRATGNQNLAIRNGILYLDSYTDLLTLPLATLENPTDVTRISNVFPSPEPAPAGMLFSHYESWEATRELGCDEALREVRRGWGWCPGCQDDLVAVADVSPGAAAGDGTGGSMARFTILGDHLYTVDESTLRGFSLDDPRQPLLTSANEMTGVTETIFPYQDHLFIGGQERMEIWEVRDDGSLRFFREFSHARACDPVYVRDGYAYVTVRSSADAFEFCGGVLNQLIVIDVDPIEQSHEIAFFDMENPRGLAVDPNQQLLVCEGADGLKFFDASDPATVGFNLLHRYDGHFANDVIPLQIDGKSVAMVIGESGLFQLDYTNPNNPVFLSEILVNP